MKPNSISLFCGAGISHAAKLPLWNELLTKVVANGLQVDATSQDGAALCKTLISLWAPDPLQSARIAKHLLGQSKDNSQKIIAPIFDALSARNRYEAKNDPLLKRIATLAAKYSSPSPFNMVTYNYDDLLETACEAEGMKPAVVAKQTDLRNIRTKAAERRVALYYVHGRIPTKLGNGERTDVVFSEEEYMELIQNPWDWRNRVQIELLESSSCVLIGLSLRDPNLRRLLMAAYQSGERPSHFWIHALPTVKDIIDGAKCDEATARTAQVKFKKSMTDSAKSIGVNIEWLNAWSELPDALEAVCARIGQVS